MSLVSVVIPTFDRLAVLKRAIQSVLSQTHTNLELIVVDDASTDETLSYLKDIKDSRLKVISLSENRGVSFARNRGIEVAQGELIALLDSDDEWLKRKLEKQVEFLKENPLLNLVHCNEKWIRNGHHLNQKKIHRKEGGRIFARALHLCLISPSAVVIRKNFLQSIGLFREDFPVCEDYELWLRITASEDIGFLEEVLLIKYGGHDDQLSHRYTAMDFWRVRAMDELYSKSILNEE